MLLYKHQAVCQEMKKRGASGTFQELIPRDGMTGCFIQIDSLLKPVNGFPQRYRGKCMEAPNCNDEISLVLMKTQSIASSKLYKFKMSPDGRYVTV